MSERLKAVAELISMCGEEASAKALTSALNGLAKAIEERDALAKAATEACEAEFTSERLAAMKRLRIVLGIEEA